MFSLTLSTHLNPPFSHPKTFHFFIFLPFNLKNKPKSRLFATFCSNKIKNKYFACSWKHRYYFVWPKYFGCCSMLIWMLKFGFQHAFLETCSLVILFSSSLLIVKFPHYGMKKITLLDSGSPKCIPHKYEFMSTGKWILEPFRMRSFAA